MSRTRSKLLDPVISSTTGRQRSRLPSGPWSAWHSPSTVNGNTFRQDSQVMVDEKTPGFFRAKRENTVIPCSPMNSTKVEHVWSPGVFNATIKQNSGSQRFYEFELAGMFWPADRQFGIKPTDPAVDGAVALQEALSRAQSDCYDALTFAAEFRKTVEGVITLRTRAETLFTRFDERVRASVRKRRFRLLEASQILAEIWLELRYMWRPLVYDMIAAEEAFRRLQEGIEDPLQRAYGTRVSTATSSRSIKTATIAYKDGARGGLTALQVSSAQQVIVEKSVHAAVGLQVTTREVYMTDPFVTGWELVPFSFVLDWFITMGDMLTAFSPFATGSLKYATLATKTVTTYRSINTLQPVSGYSMDSLSSSIPCIQQKVDTTYVRTLANPVPTLAFDVQLNKSKLLDLVALWLVGNKKTLTRLLRHF